MAKRPRVSRAAKSPFENASAQIQNLTDLCSLFDDGKRDHFLGMSVVLRAFCHSGQGASLIAQMGIKNTLFPSSSERNLRLLHTASSDLFMISLSTPPTMNPNLRSYPEKRNWLKFKNWWKETVIVDGHGGSLSRGNIVVSVANFDGAHHSFTIDEVYRQICEENSMRLFFREHNRWQDFGLAPIQCAVRQIAHEFLIGLMRLNNTELGSINYDPEPIESSSHAIAPGFEIVFADRPSDQR